MKTFKEFISEISYNVPVVSIDKNQVDLDDENTVNELNKNLSIALSKDFSNSGEGLNAAKKILTMYGIELPEIDFKNKKEGSVSIPVSQYKSSGENHFDVTAPFTEKNEKHKFTFNYSLKDGKYDVSAEVTVL
jgi:hypothetical protein